MKSTSISQRKGWLQIAAKVQVLALLAGVALFYSGCASEQSLNNKPSLTQEPVLNAQLAKEDFAFPSRPPRLSHGKVIFEQNCAVCHHGNLKYDKIKTERPIDTYLMLTRGDNNHPVFKNLTRDERWEALFYARYLAGGADIKNKNVSAIFGSNCAVCHGAKGFADGPLYTGHGPHELGMAPVKNAFDPPPANFHSYARMYNRTDDQMVKFITEGVYPSAMPSWKGREDKAKGVVFDDALILDLVKYVRQFSYENDIDQAQSSSSGPASKSKNGKTMSQAVTTSGLEKRIQ